MDKFCEAYGDQQLSKLTVDTILDFLNQLTEGCKPQTKRICYGHLAAFIRNAPDSQKDALWRVIGATMQQHVSDYPLWLNTAGGGIAWLHVRLDSRPKYYGFRPYKTER